RPHQSRRDGSNVQLRHRIRRHCAGGRGRQHGPFPATPRRTGTADRDDRKRPAPRRLPARLIRTTMELLSIGILASGSGTNFDSIAAAVASGEIPARIAVLVCNRPAAPVIAKAKARGIPVRVVEHRAYATRELFDTDVASTLETAGVGLVVMAGFDRLITG